MRALALVLVLASVAFAQGQPGRPSRGATTGGGVSATATPAVSVGPLRRCLRTFFYSGAPVSNYKQSGVYGPGNDAQTIDSTVALTTSSALTYTPRQYCNVGTGANTACSNWSYQPLLTQRSQAPWSAWFRWVNGPSGSSSTAYVGMRPNAASAAAVQVSCAVGGTALQNSVYLLCDGAFVEQQVCVNGADASPTCVGTGFSCSTTTAYDVTFTYQPSSTSIIARVQDLNSGAAFTNTFTSDLPADGIGLGFASSACTGTQGVARPFQAISYFCLTTE